MVAARSTTRGVVMVDVAKRAGVSQKTVSRVVNNAPYVRPDVRDKVNAAIEELGYRPNVAARALASQRTHTIGMLVVGASLSGPARRLFSVDQAARKHGYTIALATVPDLRPDSVAEGVESLLSRGIEGLVIEIPNHLATFDVTALADLPVITSAGRIAGLARQTVVDVDQASSARAATAYLLGLGHRTVFHIAGPRDWDAAEKRQHGWRSALQEAGAHVPRVLFGDWSCAHRLPVGSPARGPARGDRDLRRQRPHGHGRAAGHGGGRPPSARRRVGVRLRRRARGGVPDGAAQHHRDRRRGGGRAHPQRAGRHDRGRRPGGRADRAVLPHGPPFLHRSSGARAAAPPTGS